MNNVPNTYSCKNYNKMCFWCKSKLSFKICVRHDSQQKLIAVLDDSLRGFSVSNKPLHPTPYTPYFHLSFAALQYFVARISKNVLLAIEVNYHSKYVFVMGNKNIGTYSENRCS